MTKKAKAETAPDLPKGILKSDLQSPRWDDYKDLPFEERSFELWLTAGFGWCIPTLGIAAGRRGQPARTYAVRVSDGGVVRIGQGPHVARQLVVYSRHARREALQPFFDLRVKGQASAGQIRDRISSRRAQGQQERADGNTFWRWRS